MEIVHGGASSDRPEVVHSLECVVHDKKPVSGVICLSLEQPGPR
jgi:hypothetical protein